MPQNQLKKQYSWLITGGSGFIGSAVAALLAKNNQNIIIYDNNPPNYKLPHKFIKGDILDKTALIAAAKGCDFIIHLAALSSVPDSLKSPQLTLDTNTNGVQNALLAAQANNVKRFIFASSASVYGNNENIPLKEDEPLNPQSPYALSKIRGEELCRKYAAKGLQTVIMRFFNVYGPNTKAGVISIFAQALAQNKPILLEGGGEQIRDFLYVDDAAAASVTAAFKGQSGQIYNVGGGKAHTLLQLADMMEALSGRKFIRVSTPPRAGDVKKSRADISKISALGFKPSVNLEEGLKKILAEIPVKI